MYPALETVDQKYFLIALLKSPRNTQESTLPVTPQKDDTFLTQENLKLQVMKTLQDYNFVLTLKQTQGSSEIKTEVRTTDLS